MSFDIINVHVHLNKINKIDIKMSAYLLRLTV